MKGDKALNTQRNTGVVKTLSSCDIKYKIKRSEYTVNRLSFKSQRYTFNMHYVMVGFINLRA